MAEFPTEIVAEILSRLPVESILRFRCVSKPWCALIDSPHFVKLQLKQSIDTKDNRKLILSDQEFLSSLYSVSMYSLDIALKLDDHFLRKPSNTWMAEVLGSCNGLLLVRRGSYTAIWNPSTRKHRILPLGTTSDDYNMKIHGSETCHYGLGYDSVHDDYKVLKITQFHLDDDVFRSEVEVYSLQMNSWRKIITDFPFYLGGSWSCGVLASGALHWIASKMRYGYDRLIVAFDLATEEYRLLPVPCLHRPELVDFHMKAASLEGSLCILCEHIDDLFTMWVMKDHGVNESWTKLLKIPEQSHLWPFGFAVPLTFSTDGTKLLLFEYSKKLIWYDLKHKVVETVNISGLRDIWRAEFYVPSLVPIGTGDTGN